MTSKKCYSSSLSSLQHSNSSAPPSSHSASSSSDQHPDLEEGEILPVKPEQNHLHDLSHRLGLNDQYIQYYIHILQNSIHSREQTEPLDLTVKKSDELPADEQPCLGSLSPNSSSDTSLLSNDDLSTEKKQSTKGSLHDDIYTCDICEKTFNKQSSLARHKYEHSGERRRRTRVDLCTKAILVHMQAFDRSFVIFARKHSSTSIILPSIADCIRARSHFNVADASSVSVIRVTCETQCRESV